MKEKPRYRYQVVSGATVWGALTTIKIARQRACAMRATRTDSEVERVLELPGNARRYWRWRGGRWSFNDHYDPAPADVAHWDYRSSNT
jgi:hypothetical protein